MRGLYSEGLIYGGKFAFQNRLGKSIVGRKFTVFALFYFLFEGNFLSTSDRGAYIWRGDLTEDFLHYRFGGLIFGGAYIWRGLFSEFYGNRVKFAYHFHINCDLNLQTTEFLALGCLLYTSPSPRDGLLSRMPSSA